ncbi:MAG: hypothetical protein ACLP1W_04580 [Rhodomicrobium sp.]
MTSQFDASFAYTGPIGADVSAAHAREIEHAMFMPSKLANAKLHANNELQRWVLACNRLVWGSMPADAREPAAGEIAALLEQLSPENRERLLKESQLAAEARNLVALLEAAEIEARARLEVQWAEQARAEAEEQARFEAQQAEMARAEAERALREEFEAIDEAGKEARFQAWRAAHGR